MNKNRIADNKKGDDEMIVENNVFQIPRDKSADFLEQFKKATISDAFLEECRQAAIKTRRIKAERNKNTK